MPVSHKNKVIFIHIPKAAGSSVVRALDIPHPTENPDHKPYFSARLTSEEKAKYGLEHHVWWIHLFASELKIYLPDDIFREYFKFAIVRNPWDRAVSYYIRHVSVDETFENKNSFEKWILSYEFLNKITPAVEVLIPQKLYITDEKGNLLVDFVGRFESLEEDWKKVCQKAGISASLPHINTSSHEHYSFYYNKKTRRVIADAFRDDIEMFGYTFEDRTPGTALRRIFGRLGKKFRGLAKMDNTN